MQNPSYATLSCAGYRVAVLAQIRWAVDDHDPEAIAACARLVQRISRSAYLAVLTLRIRWGSSINAARPATVRNGAIAAKANH